MYIVCPICRDNFIQSDDIYVIRCGHVFHLNCLSRWLTGSSTCPECREKTSQEKSRRLYITFTTDETSLSMQDRIDSLKFQVLLHEKNIKYYTSKNETLEKQNAGLRQEVRKVEREINEKSSTNHLLKEQLKTSQNQTVELKKKYAALGRELEERETEIKLLQFTNLVHGSVIGTDEGIVDKIDRDTLLTCMKTMKRDMSENAKQWELLHEHIKRCMKKQTEVLASIKDFRRPEITHNIDLVDNLKDVITQIRKMEELISLHPFVSTESTIFNSQMKLNESSDTDEEVMFISSKAKVNARQENESIDVSLIEVGIEASTSAKQDKHPIPRKRKLL